MTDSPSIFDDSLPEGTDVGSSQDASQPVAALLERAKDDVGAPFEPEALEMLRQLRAGDPAGWVRARRALGDAGVPLRDLDGFTKASEPAPEAGDKRQGQALALEDPEPWPESVDGAELLDELQGLLGRFITAPQNVLDVMAAWILFAHAVDAFDISPVLCIASPVKRCGKTTALQLVGAAVPRALSTSNTTPAALFRSIERWHPTLLIDEADALFGARSTERSEEIRGLLNAGHTRGTAYVIRVVGEDHEPRRFGVFGAKCIALIGSLPDTVRDRSIIVPMRRRLPGERLERLRLDRLGSLVEALRRKAARWVEDHAEVLRAADPEVPNKIASDRAQDNARPLLAIVDACGGAWPERLRAALTTLASEAGEDEADELGVSLLQAVWDAMTNGDPPADKLPTPDLLHRLNADPEAPWADWRMGEGMSARQLASRLKRFGVRPAHWREGTATPRGYCLDDLRDAISRYSPGIPRPDVTQATHDRNHSVNTEIQSGTQLDLCRIENREKPNDYRRVSDVSSQTGVWAPLPGEADAYAAEERRAIREADGLDPETGEPLEPRRPATGIA